MTKIPRKLKNFQNASKTLKLPKHFQNLEIAEIAPKSKNYQNTPKT